MNEKFPSPMFATQGNNCFIFFFFKSCYVVENTSVAKNGIDIFDSIYDQIWINNNHGNNNRRTTFLNSSIYIWLVLELLWRNLQKNIRYGYFTLMVDLWYKYICLRFIFCSFLLILSRFVHSFTVTHLSLWKDDDNDDD